MKNITDSARVIMDILWEESPLPAAEIIRRARKTEPWADNTVRTFLTRLSEKGMVRIDKGDVNLYSASVSFEQAGLSMAKATLKKMFNGSINKLMVSFIDNNEVSKEELDELRSLLNQRK